MWSRLSLLWCLGGGSIEVKIKYILILVHSMLAMIYTKLNKSCLFHWWHIILHKKYPILKYKKWKFFYFILKPFSWQCFDFWFNSNCFGLSNLKIKQYENTTVLNVILVNKNHGPCLSSEYIVTMTYYRNQIIFTLSNSLNKYM